jgi:DNA helicase-2/ATP-dependent DNA helicase PcrA
MTIHSAKGLEFACVFVGGIEETLFPSAMSINTREELEEERRLFYVAITRAKKNLWLTYSNTRYRFGQLVQNEPSRFIEEIPHQYIDKSFAGGGARNQGHNDFGGTSAFDRMSGNSGWKSNSARVAETYGPPAGRKETKPAYMPVAPVAPKIIEHTPSAGFVASDTSGLMAGHKVEHQKFGFGEVIKLEGSAHNPIATVKFENNGEKKIMLNYAKLRIV